MTNRNNIEEHSHGPENAEHEIKKAYNSVIEMGVAFAQNPEVHGVNPEDVTESYKHAYDCLRKGDRLAAERWARTVKHLARAFWHEAKIAYLEPRDSNLPFLTDAKEEYGLKHHSDTTADLLESVSYDVPPGMERHSDQMKKYLGRGKQHLSVLEKPEYKHELLRAERIQAAHEYGRVLECMALAVQAESQKRKTAAA